MDSRNILHLGGPDGSEYEGVSFQTTRSTRYRDGDPVTIEYPQGRPEISRIKGMRRGPVRFMGLIPLPFLLLGLLMILDSIRECVKANRLLALGEQTTGRLKSKEEKGQGETTFYKLTFEFNTHEGTTYQTMVESQTGDITKLEDQAEEPLLYDPRRPSYAVMLDDLPGEPRIQQDGTIRAGPAIKTIMALIIPLATIIGHGIYLYIKFFR